MNLSQCPFCGRSNTIYLCDKFDAGEIAWIHCAGCMCNGPSVYSENGDVIGQAIEAWNKRNPPTIAATN
jgi:hypothetical protein